MWVFRLEENNWDKRRVLGLLKLALTLHFAIFNTPFYMTTLGSPVSTTSNTSH